MLQYSNGIEPAPYNTNYSKDATLAGSCYQCSFKCAQELIMERKVVSIQSQSLLCEVSHHLRKFRKNASDLINLALLAYSMVGKEVLPTLAIKELLPTTCSFKNCGTRKISENSYLLHSFFWRSFMRKIGFIYTSNGSFSFLFFSFSLLSSQKLPGHFQKLRN